jgi:hypothetical protein
MPAFSRAARNASGSNNDSRATAAPYGVRRPPGHIPSRCGCSWWLVESRPSGPRSDPRHTDVASQTLTLNPGLRSPNSPVLPTVAHVCRSRRLGLGVLLNSHIYTTRDDGRAACLTLHGLYRSLHAA